MITTEQLSSLSGKTVRSQADGKIGKVVDVYASVDGDTGTFVTVSTGLFGNKHTFVPLREATLDGDDVVVPYSKDVIHDAPRLEDDEDLTEAEEGRLYEHYGLEAPIETAGTTGTTGTAPGSAETAAAAVAAPALAPTTSAAAPFDAGTAPAASATTDDGSITLSEERLRVGTRTTESGRARLRKFVTTEQQSATIPVSHEELVVEREVITDGRATGAQLSEEVREVVLTEEVPVVAKETVPVERVRVGTTTVTEDVTVTDEVSKEHIDVDEGREARTR